MMNTSSEDGRQIVVMSEGEVVEQGSSADLVQYPTHTVTKKIFSVMQPFPAGSVFS
jgi:ABC-type antimicrobial peptide transport system ATPase subunit